MFTGSLYECEIAKSAVCAPHPHSEVAWQPLGTHAGSAVAVGVWLAVSVTVGVGVTVCVCVAVAVIVRVRVMVAVLVAVAVPVAVAVGVLVGTAVKTTHADPTQAAPGTDWQDPHPLPVSSKQPSPQLQHAGGDVGVTVAVAVAVPVWVALGVAVGVNAIQPDSMHAASATGVHSPHPPPVS